MKDRSKFPGVLLLIFLLCLGVASLERWGAFAEPPQQQQADNSRCFVCHLNYEDELLAAKHAAGGIGCITCHGISSPHASDEDHATAPDTMYPRENINAACLKCHDGEKWKLHHPSLGEAAGGKGKVCTDCHGEHRLRIRSRHWDKTNGRLIPKTPPRQEREAGE